MARLNREQFVTATDLKTEEVELPSIGGSVLVTGLSAAYANEARGEAVETVIEDDRQVGKLNVKRLEVLQVFHGLVDPKLNSELEAEQFMKNCGPAARAVVDKIDELSAIDKEAIAKTAEEFPSRPNGEDLEAAPAEVGGGAPAEPSGGGD